MFGGISKPHTFAVSDLRRCLAPLSLTRRKAVMYCLESRCDPSRIADLRWPNVWGASMTPLARSIVHSMPRHLWHNHVFWEFNELLPGVAVPLFGLGSIVQVVANMSFTKLQASYDNMIWIDEEAEAHAFRKSLAEVVTN
jgi:hypothetical protein